MSVIQSSKIVELSQAKDPKKALVEAVNVNDLEVPGENILVATYIRPEKTTGGIIRPESNIKEDEFQGNIGLVIKLGEGLELMDDLLHKWVIFGYTDGLRFRYDGVPCRIISVERIRATVKDPSKVL